MKNQMNTNKFIKIYTLIVTILFLYFAVSSIQSFISHDPNIKNFMPNQERLYGASILGAIPGLPLSIPIYSYFAKVLDTQPELWIVIVYNVINLILGFFFWIYLPNFLVRRFRKNH